MKVITDNPKLVWWAPASPESLPCCSVQVYRQVSSPVSLWSSGQGFLMWWSYWRTRLMSPHSSHYSSVFADICHILYGPETKIQEEKDWSSTLWKRKSAHSGLTQFDTVQLAYYNILDFGAQFPTKAMVHSRIALINKHEIDSHILKKLSRVTMGPVKSVTALQIFLVVLPISAWTCTCLSACFCFVLDSPLYLLLQYAVEDEDKHALQGVENGEEVGHDNSALVDVHQSKSPG